MGRRSRRYICSLVIVGLASTVLWAQPAEAREPLRSGTIVGGYVVLMGPPTCESTADCAAWLTADCDPRFAGRNPGVFSSIVDIRKFARTKRTLLMSSEWLAGRVEFWTRDCRSAGALPRSFRWQRFTVPSGTRWMTITTGSVALHWELW